MHLLSSK